MPVVVAFGDSNTWGFSPGAGGRMARDVRWPGVMARALGQNFQVIEEGLCGRTTMFDDPEEDGRNGLAYFAPCLRSHAPLDLVIIALGCNDVKARFAAAPETVADGAGRLIDVALASSAGPDGAAPEAVLVAPPPIENLTEYSEMFEGGAEKALRLPAVYRTLAERRSVGFVDAGQFIRCSPLDGVHYAPDQHLILGAAMAEAVRMMLA
jgi:lysophospholipase L1-like esterase